MRPPVEIPLLHEELLAFDLRHLPSPLAAPLLLRGPVLADQHHVRQLQPLVLRDHVAVEVDGAEHVPNGIVPGLQQVPQVGLARPLFALADLSGFADGGLSERVAAIGGRVPVHLDVHNVEDGGHLDSCQAVEGGFPVQVPWDGPHAKSVSVHEDDARVDLHAEADGTEPPHRLGVADRKAHKVLTADGGNVHRETVVDQGVVALAVVADELLCRLPADRGHLAQEVNHSLGMTAVGVVEVHPVRELRHFRAVLVHPVLQDQPLQEEERPLVVHPLPGLHPRIPHLLPRLVGLAGLAHLAHDDELYHCVLLDDGAGEYLLLHCQLHLQTLGVGLGPDEGGVHEMHLLQPFDSLQAEGQQLLGLQRSHQPVLRRVEVPLTVLAELHGALLADALCDVDVRLHAANAHVGRVGLHAGPADTA
mmetsp:Transcript_80799/g.142391  ORF Transcript_80799/g.142391 Transcript_80799/m.142391 type:complete len:420 (+) Transcript_80799:520-1779(+)